MEAPRRKTIFISIFIAVQGSQDPKAKLVHIDCHDGDHYSSVRRASDNTESPPNIWIEVGKVHKDVACLLSKHKNDRVIPGAVRVIRDADSLVSKEHKNDQVKHVEVKAVRDTDSHLSKEHKNDHVKDGKVKVVTDTESLLAKDVREATRCDDEERILEALLDSTYDVDAAIAIILQEMETLPSGKM